MGIFHCCLKTRKRPATSSWLAKSALQLAEGLMDFWKQDKSLTKKKFISKLLVSWWKKKRKHSCILSFHHLNLKIVSCCLALSNWRLPIMQNHLMQLRFSLKGYSQELIFTDICFNYRFSMYNLKTHTDAYEVSCNSLPFDNALQMFIRWTARKM